MKHHTLGLVAFLVILAGGARAEDAVKNTVVKETSLEFFVAADPIQFAVASGDLQTGPHGTFGKFPANFETPKHLHTHSYQAVVISGEMTNPFDGETNPPIMKPGSFWSVTGGTNHSTACVSDTPASFSCSPTKVSTLPRASDCKTIDGAFMPHLQRSRASCASETLSTSVKARR